MSIENIMTDNVITVTMDDSLIEVNDIFESNNFHHLLVVDYGKLCGIISDRDLLKAISPNAGTRIETAADKATLNKKAHQIMTRKLMTLTIDAELNDAIDIFKKHSISCIPVIDADNKPVGIISWRDIINTL